MAIDSPNLPCCLLMAVSDLEKRKRINFQEKRYADARANIKQKPYGASWIVDTQNLKRVLQPIDLI